MASRLCHCEGVSQEMQRAGQALQEAEVLVNAGYAADALSQAYYVTRRRVP